MQLQRFIRSFALISGVVLPLGLSSACIWRVGEADGDEGSEEDWGDPCPNGGTNNRINISGECECEVGYDWCTADDEAQQLNCCERDPLTPCDSGTNNHLNNVEDCECNAGFTWCSDDPNVLDCCPIDSTSNSAGMTTTTTDPTTGSTGGTSGDTGTDGDTGDDDSGGSSVHPQDPCTEEGSVFCSHDVAMGPAGSVYYVCIGMSWVAQTAMQVDQLCKDIGSDFAFGCVDNADTQSVEIKCGMGPGTACDPTTTANACVDMITLSKCVDGRLAYENCDPSSGGTCEVDGVQFEYGECNVQDGIASCLCSDEPPMR